MWDDPSLGVICAHVCEYGMEDCRTMWMDRRNADPVMIEAADNALRGQGLGCGAVMQLSDSHVWYASDGIDQDAAQIQQVH